MGKNNVAATFGHVRLVYMNLCYSGGYVCVDSICAVIATLLKASQRNRDDI